MRKTEKIASQLVLQEEPTTNMMQKGKKLESRETQRAKKKTWQRRAKLRRPASWRPVYDHVTNFSLASRFFSPSLFHLADDTLLCLYIHNNTNRYLIHTRYAYEQLGDDSIKGRLSLFLSPSP